jgi:hypothetical protein
MKLQERNTFGALCHTSHVVTTPSKCSVAILPRNLLPSIPRKTIIALWVLSYAGESMNSLGSLIADLAAIASHEGVLMDFRDEYTLALANFVVGLGHSVPSGAAGERKGFKHIGGLECSPPRCRAHPRAQF